MPYQVTSITQQHKYTSIIPRKQLAYTIIKYLVRQGLTLADFHSVLARSQLSPTHILSDDQYEILVTQHPEMSMIYECIRLNNTQYMYFHTNWTVATVNWQAMSAVLAEFNIQVETVKTPDNRQHSHQKTSLTTP